MAVDSTSHHTTVVKVLTERPSVVGALDPRENRIIRFPPVDYVLQMIAVPGVVKYYFRSALPPEPKIDGRPALRLRHIVDAICSQFNAKVLERHSPVACDRSAHPDHRPACRHGPMFLDLTLPVGRFPITGQPRQWAYIHRLIFLSSECGPIVRNCPSHAGG